MQYITKRFSLTGVASKQCLVIFMNKSLAVVGNLSCVFVCALVLGLAFSGCSREEEKIRATATHYTDGQEIPGVGTAMGDVYVLPDGGCFGGAGKCGIHYKSGARTYFGSSVTAVNPAHP
jgi:hypothetical protein